MALVEKAGLVERRRGAHTPQQYARAYLDYLGSILERIDTNAVAAIIEELEAARREEARVAARIEEASAELDRIVADQEKTRERLRSRAVFMYRSGRESFLSVLLSAHSFEELATRWELLVRLNRQDEEDLRALEAARAALERTAEDLMSLQAQQARAVDALEERVARARQELSASETALKEYNARVAATASAARAAPKAATDVTQHLTGSGAWRTAVASHYARDFTGRGASGEEIGPYSMIVAHKTLPFGTPDQVREEVRERI
ncbi:MAG: hypothetical protein QHJ73_17230, partial [Armatimonadota bacterium]|nr:hypothetical protein [Armatimonadota bacterium]